MAFRAARTVDWQYQIHIVDEAGEIKETVGLLLGFGMAEAAFNAAAQTYSDSKIELRQRARVLRTIRTGAYDHVTKVVAVVNPAQSLRPPETRRPPS